MAINPYFSQKVRSEQQLYEDIIIESLKIYGQDVYYLPRTIVNENRLFGEDVPSSFGNAYKIEMYVENTEGFDGEGDLYTRFGVEIRDAATFVVSKRRWSHMMSQVSTRVEIDRPKEGDLIYLGLSKSMFQVMHVEHEQPFYQLSQFPTYKLRCELFEYSEEDFDTGIASIDDIEKSAYRLSLLLSAGEDSNIPDFFRGEVVQQKRSDGITMKGEVLSYNKSTGIVELIHIGADSGGYALFELTRDDSIGLADSHYTTWLINDRVETPFGGTAASILGDSDPRRKILAIAESTNELEINAQNSVFDAASGNNLFDFNFLDFTEKNPFGDPEDT